MAHTMESLMNKVFGWNTAKPEDLRNMSLNDAVQDMAKYQDMYAMQNAQSMQNMAGTYTLGGGGGGGSAQWFTAAGSRGDAPLRELSEGDLEHPAGKAGLEELADFWVTRWGHNWVKRTEIDDDFYTIAAIRLLNGGYLEAHELSSGTRVYRLHERK
jgi:hypothetical protein